MSSEAQLLHDARGWIADCCWADDFDVSELTDAQVKSGIQRHYDGGWPQFAADGS